MKGHSFVAALAGIFFTGVASAQATTPATADNLTIYASPQRSFGSMPLIVMTAGKSNFNPDLPAAEQSKLDATWWTLHEQVARLSRRGEHRMVAEASHFIPKDDPDAVVAAIDELVQKAR